MNAQPPKAKDTSQRLRQRAIAVYALAAIASIIWGLSYDLFYDKGLGVELHAGATSEGSTFLSVRNTGSLDWTGVNIVVDERFYLRVKQVPRGGSTDAQLSAFANVYRIPRPLGGYLWEGLGTQPEPAFAPTNYRPTSVAVETEQGRFRTDVTF